MVLDGPVGPARLTVACLDCARFDATQPAALIAAAASSAPYAMVLGLAAATYATASPLALTVLAAGFANEGASLGLKHLFGIPRPAKRCKALATCGKAGMPSSHAQNVAFAWSVHAGLATAGLVGAPHARNGGKGSGGRAALPAWWPAAESSALAALAALIGWARVALGYHTWDQVGAGWAVGAVVGALTAAAIRRRWGGGGTGKKGRALPPAPARTTSPDRRRYVGTSPRKLASPTRADGASPLPPWRR